MQVKWTKSASKKLDRAMEYGLRKLIYYIGEKEGVIYITNFWDTRREPKQLDEETK